MGFRIQKSTKIGPFRINASKSGIGYSVGWNGFRVTKKANGGTRTTVSVPGTGISYVKDGGSKKKKSGNSSKTSKGATGGTYMGKPANKNIELVLCLLLGWAGGHKFYQKKIGMGVLYLLTFGLLGIGWIGDVVTMCVEYFGSKRNGGSSKFPRAAGYIIAFVFVLILGGCSILGGNGNTNPDPGQTNISATDTSTEPSSEDTTAHTDAATETTESETEAATTEDTIQETDAQNQESSIGKTEEPTEAAAETTTEAQTETPTNSQTEEPTQPETTEEQETLINGLDPNTIVYVSNSGKIHLVSDCSGMKNYKEMTLKEAVSRGYEYCKNCW